MARSTEELVEIFRALGANDPEGWASSQVEEGINQLHRFLFLRKAWQQVAGADGGWIDRVVEAAARRPDDPFAGAGHAIRRMLAAGVDRHDIIELVRASQGELLSAICYLLDDPSLTDDEQQLVGDLGWALVETDDDFEPTGEVIGGLQDSVLDTDPEGREMRPRILS